MNEMVTQTSPRLLLALDETEAQDQAIEQAARIATSIGAELVGLYFENRDLLTAAALPPTSLVTRHGAGTSALDVRLMQRALRVRAKHTESALAQIADRLQTRWSFQVVREDMSEHTNIEGRSGDIVTICRQRHRTIGPGSSSLDLFLQQRSCSVCVLKNQVAGNTDTVILYAGQPRALDLAYQLVSRFGGQAHVLVVGKDQNGAEKLDTSARQWLQDNDIASTTRAVAACESAALSGTIKELRPRFLLIDDHDDSIATDGIEDFIEQEDCTVFFVR